MCFSAEASFTASLVLVAVGTVCVSKAETPEHKVVALTPFLFGIQQLSEGILWVTLKDSELDLFRLIMPYIFTLFGQVLWPTWIPLSAFLIESSPKIKRILKLFLIFGITMSLFLLYSSAIYPIEFEEMNNHIRYNLKYPYQEVVDQWNYLYLIPTVGALLLSSLKKVKLFGLLLLFAFFVSKLYYYHSIFSVWCFFSAILSLVIYFIIRDLNKQKALDSYIPPS